MKRPWSFLENPFLSSTDNSYRMAVRISTYHNSALNANTSNPVIAALYATYNPIHRALVEAYDAFIAQEGMQQGESLNLRQLLRLEGTTKISFWDASIQVRYPSGTPQYMALLPNGRKPFQSGTQTQRISAVASLSDAIGTDAALAAVKNLPRSFRTRSASAAT